MSNRFQKLLQRLDLTPRSPDVFVGGAGEGGVGSEARLFGGLVAAQAVMAVQRTVADFSLHSLHAYFLRPGRASREIAYHVKAMKDGRNFAARQVEAWQSGECIFQLSAGFHRGEQGPRHQPAMPAAPPPEDCPNRDQLRGRSHWQDMPIDVRMVTEITAGTPLPADQKVWLRANGELPEDPRVHLALLVYASDRCLLDTAFRPHADRGEMSGASLDHSMWFHATPRIDDWLLYHTTSPIAANGRGLAMGTLYERSGACVATATQEGSVRFR